MPDDVILLETLKQRRRPDTTRELMGATILDLDKSIVFTELIAAMARTTASTFCLTFDDSTIDTPQVTINVGLLLNTLSGGCLLGAVVGDCEEISLVPSRVQFGTFDLSCMSVLDTVFAATCSAVADLPSDAKVSTFHMGDMSTERWQWLAYALCCGSSSVLAQEVRVSGGRLTKLDLLAIEAVFQTNYPRPVLERGQVPSPQYGFVDISAGTKLQLQLGGLADGGNTIRVISGERRCRAVYKPGEKDNYAELIVPGYGVCKTKLGGQRRFTPGSENAVLQRKRVSGSLDLSYVKVESTTVKMDLLALITCGLHYLSINEDEDNLHQLDLTALSAACPDLQGLFVENFNVVVSSHDEKLRRWPIKKITISWSTCLWDLTSCLEDRSLRMTRELVKVMMIPPEDQPFDEEKVREFTAHDGEFLPVVKDKLPLQSKAAMLML